MKIAIVGCGAFGHALARAAVTDGHRIAACVDPSRERAKAFADEFGVTPMKWSAALKSGVEAAVIASPTPTHTDYLAAAAVAKLPVIASTPLCRTSAEAKKIVAAFHKTRTSISLAPRGPDEPALAAMKAQYAHGKVGKAGFVRVVHRTPPPTGVKNWYRDLSQSGGVVFNDLLADFEWLIELIGDPTRVFAQLVRKPGREFLEYALVTLTFSSGAIAQLIGSWAQPHGTRTTLEICGDAGMIQFDSQDHALDYFPRDGGAEIGDHPWLRVRAPADDAALDIAVRAIAVAEAALRSAESGKAEKPKGRGRAS